LGGLLIHKQISMKKINLFSIIQKKLLILVTIIALFTGCEKDDLIPGGGGGGGTTPTTGLYVFWVASDFGCGNITVTINGISKLITGPYSTVPPCNSSGAATFDLPAGTYAYTASCAGLNWSGVITVIAGGCFSQQLTSAGGGGGSTTGQGMFWVNSDFGCGPINVICNGITKTITSFYASVPACGASGAATFDLNPGTYSYTASCTGKTWNGTITITAGGCSATRLLSSGGGGSTIGQGMFWVASDLGCGNITVVCNGNTRVITTWWATAPPCGNSGTATFDLPPGTYPYTASCTGKNWSGNITVTAGGCQKVQLTSSGGGSSTGQAMFWTAFDRGCGNINVVINGVTKQISSYYTSSIPACGASGCATFDLPPGTYSYSASCSGWSTTGTVTVTAGGCMRVQFT
jgi:hypothetical protein